MEARYKVLVSGNERPEVILDEHGEPVGPNDKVVSDLSYFLGTIARNSDFCPLIYTNFKALLKDYKDRIWKYVMEKFIISKNGEKAIFCRINDAWRRYKCHIKRQYFIKYPTMKERLKHRPQSVPEHHFKNLIAYWKNVVIQSISEKNASNRKTQKYMHRMGPINFARVRAQLSATKKDGEEVTRAEMFIKTRQGRPTRKGKAVDEETLDAISMLEGSMENASSETMEKTFESMFGKERPGRVRCYGRTVTPSILKRNQEIAAIHKGYAIEVNSLTQKVEGLEAIVKFVLKQQNPDLNEGDIEHMMSRVLRKENSVVAPGSSTSTHDPYLDQV
ncbi:uncharacterized protein [Phaseolus vulgaris]|uniref:uncharacterized protein n=1 Tax=Phaseolus vulgaris TaxID=3885 RepID=UPI0035CAB40B